MADNALVVATVATANYFHYARALADSIHRVCPELPVYACAVDRPLGIYRHDDPRFRVFDASELAIPDFRRFAFQYTQGQIGPALKPFALEHVLRVSGAEKVIFLDADMQVFQPLDGLATALDQCDVLLTPHLTAPLADDGGFPTELSILRCGAINTGMIGLRRGPNAEAFLRWWKQKMSRHCYSDLASGVHVDQTWVDLAPGLFDGVALERRPGYNVAYWNLPDRPLARDGHGTLTAGGEPLVCFHYSGFDPDHPQRLSRYDGRFSDQDPGIVRQLCADYARLLDSCGRTACRKHVYRYECLSDGTPIHPLWRQAVLRGHSSLADIDDPFDVSTRPDLKSRYRRCEVETYFESADIRLEFFDQHFRRRLTSRLLRPLMRLVIHGIPGTLRRDPVELMRRLIIRIKLHPRLAKVRRFYQEQKAARFRKAG